LLSENPQALQTAASELPKDIVLKAVDHMRLSIGSGRDAGVRCFEQFLDALSPSEFETFRGVVGQA
jgi:hypothetical protein